MMEHRIREESEMATVVEAVFDILPQKNTAHVLALSGELGAGKTAFVKAAAKRLNITEHITSPTFVIMKIYEAPEDARFQRLVHIDAYRIEDDAEMNVIPLEDFVKDEKTLVCIEWPEKIPARVPVEAMPITFEIGEGDERIVTYAS